MRTAGSLRPGRGRLVALIAVLLLGVGVATATAGPAAAAGPSSHCGFTVYGAIADKYVEWGAEAGPLGNAA